MKTFKQFLNESSLSRVYQHTQDRNIGLITAHRKEFTPEENKTRNSQLKNDIHKAGFGHVHVRGSYIENKGAPQEKKVDEHSFLVIGKKGNDSGNLKGFLQKHGEKYGQDSIFHKEHNETRGNLIGTPHSEKAFPAYHEHHDVGVFHPSKIGDYHSTMRGKRSFTFDRSNTGTPSNTSNIEHPHKFSFNESEDQMFDITFTTGGYSFFNRSGQEQEFC